MLTMIGLYLDTLANNRAPAKNHLAAMFHQGAGDAVFTKVDPSPLLPGVQADLWAMVTMANLQSRG